jgi:ABC-2 type transport system ATP-binding protein
LSELSQVETVLSALREANVVVQDMQLQEVDLEDVFLNLVGNHKGVQA